MIFTELAWHTQIGYPILTLLQVLPLLAVPVMLLLRNRNALTGSGFLFALAEFLLAVDLYRHYDHDNNAFQFAERLNLLGPLNYHAAVDGISILFILLTTLLALLVILYGRIRNYSALSQYFVILFVVESSLVSMFVTVDLLWFVLLYALQLLPIGLLVWRWATSVEKDKALLRFLQFMSTGFLLLLCGTIMLGRQHVAAGDGNWTFDLFELVRNPIPGTYDSIIFFLLFYGMAIRVPLFPLHGWLPRVAEHGSIAVAPVFLLGLKIGIYGILRFIFPLLPEAVMHWHVYVVTFAVTGVFYAALLAMLQDNLRRLLAYAVVSHTSILVIGLFSLNHLAIQGSMFLSVNFGLAIAGLLFMTGLVFMRTRTTLLPQLGGLFDRIPIIGATFFVAGLAIVGMPGTPGFDGAHLVLEAAMHHFGALVTIAAAIGNVVAAGFLLWAFQRAFLSPPRAVSAGKLKPVPPAGPLEITLALAIVMVLLITGFYSEPWLELIEKSAQLLSTPFVRPAG